uniref:Uncharacterized protein n=1 Tax=Glossina pallidipes TaxID=7398 RepID=A0A1A9ZN16_GLOPL
MHCGVELLWTSIWKLSAISQKQFFLSYENKSKQQMMFPTNIRFNALAFLTLFAVAVTALPAGDETRIGLETLEEDLRLVDVDQVTGELKRDKRVTCNIGEWVCVAHCNSKSKKSGYCQRGSMENEENWQRANEPANIDN